MNRIVSDPPLTGHVSVDFAARNTDAPICQPEVVTASPPGITLIELAVSCAILALIVMIAIPKYGDWRNNTNIARAASDLVSTQFAVTTFTQAHGSLPNNLNQVGVRIGNDPWGHAYQFCNFSTGCTSRKDRFLNPINSTYDLYSMGRDGLTHSNLTSPQSRDDIVRAQDGAFVGLASNF